MTTYIKHRCWAEIDLGALERNIKRIRSALPPYIQYVAVVKADAYGHGMKPVVSRLMHSGANMFAVASIKEAAEIREIGSGWPILMLSPLLPEEDKEIIHYDIIPTISTLDEINRFVEVSKSNNTPIKVHLKIDTGMGRLGVWHANAIKLYNEILTHPEIKLGGIYTHFSSADHDQEFTELQRLRFFEVLSQIKNIDDDLLIHADNSAGLETSQRESPFNAVRVGLLQFGILPYPNSLLSCVNPEPVFSFHSRVGLIKELPVGTGISYGQTVRLERTTQVAIVTAGYGDGIPTTVSNKAVVLINGNRCPILGRVTMDQTIVDITDFPGIITGDQVTLIGKQKDQIIDVLTFSEWSKHIPWEIYCSITKRVSRLYRTESAI